MSNNKHKQDQREKLQREYDELTEEERKLDLEEQNAQGQSGGGGSGESSSEPSSEPGESEDESEDGERSEEGEDTEDENTEGEDSEDKDPEETDNEDGQDGQDDSDDEDGDDSDKTDLNQYDLDNAKSDGDADGDADGDKPEDKYSEDDKKDSESEGEDEKVNSEDRRKLNPDRKEASDKEKNKDKKDTGKDDKGSDKDGKGLKEQAANKIAEKVGGNSKVMQKAAQAKQLATAAASAVKGFVSSFAFLIKLLVNPVFWITIGVILLIIALISTFSVMGGNNYNKLCDNNGVGGVSIGDDVDDFTRQSAIASWLMNTPFDANGGQPMNKEQAAAIVGNFMLEANMANPKAIGGDNTVTLWQTCDNNCIESWGSTGKPIGIAQWLGSRRVALMETVRAEGTEWYDLSTQLKFLKVELDGGEGTNLANSSWSDPGNTLEDYTWIWQDKFERAGESRTSAEYLLREGYAQQFYAAFDGSAVSGGGGLSSKCVGGGGGGVVDASSVTSLAMSIAYTREEKAQGLGYGNCGGNPGCGMTFSKPEYVSAKNMVYAETGSDTAAPNLLASCDRLVAIMVRGTGIDPNFPYGNTGTQVNYMNNSSSWERVSCQNKQPGDVFGRSGHIMIYAGIIDGKETMVSASIGTRAAHMANISCTGDLFRGDNMSVPGWRKVN